MQNAEEHSQEKNIISATCKLIQEISPLVHNKTKLVEKKYAELLEQTQKQQKQCRLQLTTQDNKNQHTFKSLNLACSLTLGFLYFYKTKPNENKTIYNTNLAKQNQHYTYAIEKLPQDPTSIIKEWKNLKINSIAIVICVAAFRQKLASASDNLRNILDTTVPKYQILLTHLESPIETISARLELSAYYALTKQFSEQNNQFKLCFEQAKKLEACQQTTACIRIGMHYEETSLVTKKNIYFSHATSCLSLITEPTQRLKSYIYIINNYLKLVEGITKDTTTTSPTFHRGLFLTDQATAHVNRAIEYHRKSGNKDIADIFLAKIYIYPIKLTISKYKLKNSLINLAPKIISKKRRADTLAANFRKEYNDHFENFIRPGIKILQNELKNENFPKTFLTENLELIIIGYIDNINTLLNLTDTRIFDFLSNDSKNYQANLEKRLIICNSCLTVLSLAKHIKLKKYLTSDRARSKQSEIELKATDIKNELVCIKQAKVIMQRDLKILEKKVNENARLLIEEEKKLLQKQSSNSKQKNQPSQRSTANPSTNKTKLTPTLKNHKKAEQKVEPATELPPPSKALLKSAHLLKGSALNDNKTLQICEEIIKTSQPVSLIENSIFQIQVYEIKLFIQDRKFDRTHRLLYFYLKPRLEKSFYNKRNVNEDYRTQLRNQQFAIKMTANRLVDIYNTSLREVTSYTLLANKTLLFLNKKIQALIRQTNLKNKGNTKSTCTKVRNISEKLQGIKFYLDVTQKAIINRDNLMGKVYSDLQTIRALQQESYHDYCKTVAKNNSPPPPNDAPDEALIARGHAIIMTRKRSPKSRTPLKSYQGEEKKLNDLLLERHLPQTQSAELLITRIDATLNVFFGANEQDTQPHPPTTTNLLSNENFPKLTH